LFEREKFEFLQRFILRNASKSITEHTIGGIDGVNMIQLLDS
jgi:hypothetical protein